MTLLTNIIRFFIVMLEIAIMILSVSYSLWLFIIMCLLILLFNVCFSEKIQLKTKGDLTQKELRKLKIKKLNRNGFKRFAKIN